MMCANMCTEIKLHSALIFVLLINTEVYGLRIKEIVIPPYKLKGEKAVLQCNYELDAGGTLYAVKWYKENEEFFRYVPKSTRSAISYKVDGIKVDDAESTGQKVVLRGVNLKTSGLYRCEVSAEAPSFSSAQKEGYLQVIVLPSSGPHITGEKKQYETGDELNLNCSSGRSYPVSILEWYINEAPASESMLRRYTTQTYPSGLTTSVLGLHLRLTSNHFLENGELRLRCRGALSLWQGHKESVVTKMDTREAQLLVKSGADQILFSESSMPRCIILCILILQIFR